jgi:hypothetical protein
MSSRNWRFHFSRSTERGSVGRGIRLRIGFVPIAYPPSGQAVGLSAWPHTTHVPPTHCGKPVNWHPHVPSSRPESAAAYWAAPDALMADPPQAHAPEHIWPLVMLMQSALDVQDRS